MKKIHALSLAAVLLLAPIAPVSDDLPLASAVHAAAQLVFLYPPYALGPYSSGDFTLTIERADAPKLFTEAYPLNQPPHEAI